MKYFRQVFSGNVMRVHITPKKKIQFAYLNLNFTIVRLRTKHIRFMGNLVVIYAKYISFTYANFFSSVWKKEICKIKIQDEQIRII